MIISVDEYLDSLGFEITEDFKNSLAHYGTKRHSGRYPWGSGGNAHQSNNQSFLDWVNELKKEGLSESEIAQGMGITVTQLRTSKSIAKNAAKAANISRAEQLKARGMSNGEIAKKMGLAGESSVRSLLAEGAKEKADILKMTADQLRERVDTGAYIDVGTGVEYQMGISRQKLDTAVALLREQGYSYEKVQVDQLGTGGNKKTTLKVLAPPGTTYKDIVQNKGNIEQVKAFSEDGGRSFLGVKKPMDIDGSRVQVIYGEDGGKQADGVIYVRPGVSDVSIGNVHYAQVRVSVEGTHYLKGMAVYKDDLPPGVDLQFNTNKTRAEVGTDPKNAMKPIKRTEDGEVDYDNPFGSTIRQRMDSKGNVTSVMNIVGHKEGSGEEGAWDQWSRNLPSQFLSKQSPQLAKQQLDLTYSRKREELDEILALTNPTVRKKLLESYSDGADSAAVHLKAAAMPRQSTHVILPINSLKTTEIYAPNFDDGTRVALVRFPHGGTFEIPELTVNNRNREGGRLLGKQAKDAVGINAKVAEQLSGADFDGDTVLVIPNTSGKIKSKSPLHDLQTFDAHRQYKGYDGMKVMDDRTMGFEMGDVSNLITDMTIKGATDSEIARAVKHSMVVIDAKKHKLNWKQSAKDQNIAQLKEKYQGKKNAGAATLISRATSRIDVNARKSNPKIDPETGKLIYEETGESWTTKTGKTRYAKTQSVKLAETDDAHTLVSTNNTLMENIYADHSNRMKSLANEARREYVRTPSIKRSPSAAKAFAPEVETLAAKLRKAVSNRPLERQAQVFANKTVSAKRAANPSLEGDALKKVKYQALEEARRRTGAKKEQIYITDSEWNAIQAGAISNKMLSDILNNADLERVKTLATPKREVLMDSSTTRRAQTMLKLGYTQAEVAAQLGVSVTTLKRAL